MVRQWPPMHRPPGGLQRKGPKAGFVRGGGGSATAILGSGTDAGVILGDTELSGLSLVFNDSVGSLLIRDEVTPANNYFGAPFSKLTFTRGSSGTYVNSAGLFATAATDVARIDYNISSLAIRGFLVEKASQNDTIFSDDLTNAAWAKVTMTAAKNQTGPDGVGNSATAITASAINGTILQTITLGSQARHTSAYVKRLVGTGTVEMTEDGATWSAITVTAAWTRVEIATQTLANPIVGFRIATSADSIAVFCVQNEAGNFMTSGIQTGAAAVARSADICTLATTLFNHSALAGSLVFRAAPFEAATGMVVAQLDDGTTNELHSLSLTSGAVCAYTVTDGGAAQTAPLTTGGTVALTFEGVAAAWQVNDFAISSDGAAVAADSAGTLPTVTTLRIGGGISAATPLSGWIRQIAHVPRRVGNAQLQMWSR